MFIFILLILVFIILIVLLKFSFNKKFCFSKFRSNNTITCGVKGAGKDLFFSLITNMYVKKKFFYGGNIDYTAGKNYKKVMLNDISLAPNTFDNFIVDNVVKIQKNNDFEDLDMFFSDLGVYLPSQEDSKLSKVYSSLPLFFALSRHLYNMNIHGNLQAYGRLWIKLREQADSYFKVLKTLKLFSFLGWFFVKVRYYSESKSCEQGLLPINHRLFNKFNKGLVDQYQATNGEIREMWLPIRKKSLSYDTRYFHQILFGKVAPTKKDKQEIAKLLKQEHANELKATKYAISLLKH